jgi:hypothetical protein
VQPTVVLVHDAYAGPSSWNREGLPMEVFDGLRSGLVKDRSQFYKDPAIQFYGANRPGYDPGAPHGLTATLQDRINAGVHAFLRS